MRRQAFVLWAAVVSVCATGAFASTIQVGPTRTYKTVAAGYNAASAGDTIEIDSGTYYQSAGWVSIAKSNMTFRGVGATRPLLDAGGSALSSKGIFVVSAGNLTVENLEFANAWIPNGSGANAAGIRFQASTLTVRNCYFHDNQDGILTDAGATSDILFEYCEFYHNGETNPANANGYGYTHNMYIGNIRNFTLRYCYSHDSNEGHVVKTRANTNYILYNLLATETSNGSFELQICQGGSAYVIGNVILQGSNSDNATIVSYGGDNGTNANPYLYLVNNTLINQRSSGAIFLAVNTPVTQGVFENNIVQWYGYETLIGGSYASQIVQTTNWKTTNANLANIAGHDFHLTAASTGAINAGTMPGTGYNSVSLVPIYQYIHPTSMASRPTDTTIDIGAYEYAAPNQAPTVSAGADQKVVEGQAVALHATASDPNNDTLSYTWTQPAGLNVALTGGATADAGFTAPTVDTVTKAAMTFTITVADGKGGLASDSVAVRVYMLGDVNQDDSVDVVDLLTFVPAFGSVAGDSAYDATCDFNNDSSVDVVDLLILVSNFGRTLAP